MADKVFWSAQLKMLLLSILSWLRFTASQNFDEEYKCTIPANLQGQWFSLEDGVNTFTTMDQDSWSKKGLYGSAAHQEQTKQLSSLSGKCAAVEIDPTGLIAHLIIKEEKPNVCYRCNEIYIRTNNVLEYRFSSCNTIADSHKRIIASDICRSLPKVTVGNLPDLYTLFSINPTPHNCRSSLEGVWQFDYVQRDKSQYGVCSSQFSNITSCQKPGSQFSINNQRFDIFYQECEGMPGTQTIHITYICLGEWYIGKNHYFATVTMGENRPEERYRCFLDNKNDDLVLGKSIYASCSSLKNPMDSPERLQLTRVKIQTVTPSCNFPKNFTGDWIDPKRVESSVRINDTHIEDTFKPDQAIERKTYYICIEQKDTRYLVARLGIDGCQVDYMCMDMLPRRHNIIRFRTSQIFIQRNFREVCSWASFIMVKDAHWLYDIYIAKNPIQIQCPIQGKFLFVQRGDMPFKTRYRGGVTLSPRDYVNCTDYEADFAVCDNYYKPYTTRNIQIDVQRCVTLDHRARPIGEYDEPDNVFTCIGFWRENVKSYLITYEQEDGFSKYSCWVYEKLDLKRIVMTKSTNTYCQPYQTADNHSHLVGAAIMLELMENERLFDNCPMLFDDGRNFYETNEVQYLFWNSGNSNSIYLSLFVLSIILLQIL